MTVRVRFAPSPTGFLHIGSVRTALYNWLFARHHKGVFILRIEDTDEVRSTKESVDAILDGMRWLGLDWDEGPEKGGDFGPYFQMQRADIYQKQAQKLLEGNKAYYCYCTPEELKERREQTIKEKKPPKYDGRCRDLDEAKKAKYEKEGRRRVVRFRMPGAGKTKIRDLVKGDIEFDNAVLDDFVIMKSNGTPIYNFANVIDDSLMEISHIIRGDDHISNTPRQVLLYEALGFNVPEFAHVAMIHGSDGGRLSKRHGATALEQYHQEGYLPQALLNYLALLGWSTSDSQQLFTIDEMVEKFSLDGCGKSAAVFDPQKLLWMNGEYLRKLEPERLVEISIPYLEKQGLVNKDTRYEYLRKIISLEQEKMKLVSDVVGLVDFFLRDDVEFDEKAVNKVLKKEHAPKALEAMAAKLKEMDEKDFVCDKLEKLTRDVAEVLGFKAGQVFHPVRVSISGKTTGPGLFEMMEVLGKEKVLKRITRVQKEIFQENA
ncbi:MAG: glutamate--tRNA ligase [bacterium]